MSEEIRAVGWCELEVLHLYAHTEQPDGNHSSLHPAILFFHLCIFAIGKCTSILLESKKLSVRGGSFPHWPLMLIPRIHGCSLNFRGARGLSVTWETVLQ